MHYLENWNALPEIQVEMLTVKISAEDIKLPTVINVQHFSFYCNKDGCERVTETLEVLLGILSL